MNTDGKTRDDITLEANQVRSKLLHTVEQLDQRRHEALNLSHQLRTHLGRLAIVAGVAVLATAAVIGLVAGRIATVAHRRRGLLSPSGWRRPERGGNRRRPFYVELLRSLALTLITGALAPRARRLIAKLMEAPPKPHASSAVSGPPHPEAAR
jgi:hypothetical protein